MLASLPLLRNRKSGRSCSSDVIPPHSSRLLADICGPAKITHIWLAQQMGYRECLLKITYDEATFPSVLVPLGDFFCLGHSMVNNFQSMLFTATTNFPYQFNKPCGLNSYVPMPFARRVVVELVNESDQDQLQYFCIEYETLEDFPEDTTYLHAEFRRANPFGGWGAELTVNTPMVDAANLKRQAYENNYVILETKGRGHYIGCNLSVTNFTGNWWGEGDDMIWVDGYKWPPDIHGTGSEDYLGHAGGMQEETSLYSGSSIFEGRTVPTPEMRLWRGDSGYQTGYVLHLENPIHFEREIKVTIEHGHSNHLANEMSSVAYWYTDRPTTVVAVPPVDQRRPVYRNNAGDWIKNSTNECPGKPVNLTDEMRRLKSEGANQ